LALIVAHRELSQADDLGRVETERVLPVNQTKVHQAERERLADPVLDGLVSGAGPGYEAERVGDELDLAAGDRIAAFQQVGKLESAQGLADFGEQRQGILAVLFLHVNLEPFRRLVLHLLLEVLCDGGWLVDGKNYARPVLVVQHPQAAFSLAR